MLEVIEWIKSNWQLMIPAIVAMAALIQFMINRATQERDRQFKEFHKLIGDLVKGPTGDAGFVDQQAAIAYELRFYSKYYTFSLRTLIGLKLKWSTAPEFKSLRLISELNRSIQYLETKVTDPNEKD